MEFKDKLKQLRTEQGLTQSQLAERLFVSRSTVAKWENGLGLPNAESMNLLESQFGVTQSDLATTQPEEVIVQKNRTLRLIFHIIGWTALMGFMIVMYIIPFAIHSGDYGFTPDMAAGAYADRAYIDTGDCRIYYFTFEGDWDDGRHWSDLQGFKVVRKHFWGCTVDPLENMRIVTHKNYVVGRLYTIKGKDGYYHILQKTKIYKAEQAGDPLIWDIPEELITATVIRIGGIDYTLEQGFYFVTQEPVRYFQIGDAWYDVEE